MQTDIFPAAGPGAALIFIWILNSPENVTLGGCCCLATLRQVLLESCGQIYVCVALIVSDPTLR